MTHRLQATPVSTSSNHTTHLSSNVIVVIAWQQKTASSCASSRLLIAWRRSHSMHPRHRMSLDGPRQAFMPAAGRCKHRNRYGVRRDGASTSVACLLVALRILARRRSGNGDKALSASRESSATALQTLVISTDRTQCHEAQRRGSPHWIALRALKTSEELLVRAASRSMRAAEAELTVLMELLERHG